jgi:putative DNA primase/helicase
MNKKPKTSAKLAAKMLRVPEPPAPTKLDVYLAAKVYKSGGLSFIPIQTDGTKMPAFILLPPVWDENKGRDTHPWNGYRKRRPTYDELKIWFRESRYEYGIAILGGSISGNLEILDLDNWDVVAPWMRLVEKRAPGLLDELVLVRTPRPGLHVYYRCSVIGANQKLARVPDPKHDGTKPKTVAETKSEGGYCVAPASPPGCHPTGRQYVCVSSHGLDQIPTITPEQREILLNCARQQNRWEAPKPSPRPPGRSRAQANQGGRPGDDFNARAEWSDILEPHGWVFQGRGSGETDHWRRPGKSRGASATTDHGGSGLLYVFSSNAPPFEDQTAYTKFHAYTLLNHGGDFRAAARALARQGYGSRRSRMCRKSFDYTSRYSTYARLPKPATK